LVSLSLDRSGRRLWSVSLARVAIVPEVLV